MATIMISPRLPQRLRLSGWLLDPTRYGILALNLLGQWTELCIQHEEAEIMAQRKLAELSVLKPITREAEALREQLEKQLLT